MASAFCRRAAFFLLWSLVFGLAYTQAPLYYSNQNQYFLHGLADAGLGFLKDDWLANTKDPTPVFSFLVSLTYRYLGENFFYVYYLLVLGVYFTSVTGIVRALDGGKSAVLTLPSFLVIFVLIHSGCVRLLSARLLGVDYPWYFQAGLAGQYVLGPSFQPSAFGVLLLLSICLFLKDRPLLAAMCSAFSAVMHSTYLLPAGIITLSYLYVLAREGRKRDVLFSSIIAAGIVAPVVAYNLANFAPTSPSVFHQAENILVDFRIPHHCLIERWLDWIAVGQLVWMLLGAWLVRGTRLFPIMCISLLVGLALTGIQAATQSATIALLFPWRASVYLMPISTGIIIWKSMALATHWLDVDRFRFAVNVSAGLVLAGLALGGVAINAGGLAFQMGDEENGLLEFVKAHLAEGDVYLLPVELPKPPKTRGQFMSDFKTLADRRVPGTIPLDLQRFRLTTGAPIIVDFKAIPYQDMQVIEWDKRLQNVVYAYQLRNAAGFSLRWLQALYRFTHVVVRASDRLDDPDLDEIYRDDHYKIFRVRSSGR
jgi:hypothetical protein